MNTNEHVIDIYEAIAGLTARMLTAARSGEWEVLSDLEAQCSTQVASLKMEAPLPALSESARQKKARIIRRILQDDRDIRELTVPWMSKLTALINSKGAERRLSQAYGIRKSGESG
jgi:flagellar protein FliT